MAGTKQTKTTTLKERIVKRFERAQALTDVVTRQLAKLSAQEDATYDTPHELPDDIKLKAKAKKLGEGQKVLFRAKRAGVAIISDFAADQEFTILKANEDGTLLLEANGKKFPAPRSYVYDATLPAEPKPRAPPEKKPEATAAKKAPPKKK